MKFYWKNKYFFLLPSIFIFLVSNKILQAETLADLEKKYEKTNFCYGTEKKNCALFAALRARGPVQDIIRSIELGADVNAIYSDQPQYDTAMELILRNYNGIEEEELVKFFLDCGFNVNSKTYMRVSGEQYGFASHLHVAIAYGSVNTVKKFILYGADLFSRRIQTPTDNFYSPLELSFVLEEFEKSTIIKQAIRQYVMEYKNQDIVNLAEKEIESDDEGSEKNQKIKSFFTKILSNLGF